MRILRLTLEETSPKGICYRAERADNFILWALSNGWKRGLQIHRKNDDGNYTPANCLFVTQLQKRNTKA